MLSLWKSPIRASPHVLLPYPPPCPQHGEVLPLKIVTYAAVSLSLAALLVAFILLALVRTLRSNLHGIHKNLIGALFFSQLVFVIGITQTGNPVRSLCRRPGGARADRQTSLGGGGSALYLKCNLQRSDGGDRSGDVKWGGLEGGED